MTRNDTTLITRAEISQCGEYRYSLTRIWDRSLPVLSWCMLNPSTADACTDDPTVRKCVGFAKRLGYGGIRIVNLFAFRARNPLDLLAAADPSGPENEEVLNDLVHRRSVMVGWGASVRRLRIQTPITWLSDVGRMRIAYGPSTCWRCLGFTKSGEPRHPLMLSYDTTTQPWPLVSSYPWRRP